MDFYTTLGSSPCRSVDLFAKTLELKLNKHIIDYIAGEHLKPEYIKINPQHTVPTIIDNGFILWDSSAILIYMAEKYDKTNTLFPSCLQKRAIINQRMHFNMSVLYNRFADYYYTQWVTKAPADPEKFKKLDEGIGFLNTFLQGQNFAVGDSLTVADFALIATISTMDILDFDFSQYTNVLRWYENIKKIVPGWSESWEELINLKKMLKDMGRI